MAPITKQLPKLWFRTTTQEDRTCQMDTINLLSWILHIKTTLIERKLSGKEPTWKYYYKSLTSNDKDLHVSPFTFYPKFEFYNGVKYGEILPNYTTYFSSQEIKDKRELFFNEIKIILRLYPMQKLVLIGYYIMIHI